MDVVLLPPMLPGEVQQPFEVNIHQRIKLPHEFFNNFLREALSF
ncbi:hypothetical protein [Thermococcus sp.]|nr:hypothetical protein [Thermococcus sp.]